MKPKMHSQSGQAIVFLLIFMSVAVIVTTAAVGLAIDTLQATSREELYIDAQHIAESGIEEALMRLLRNPSYTGGTLTVGQGSATITVTGSTTKTIVSKATIGTGVASVQATATYINGILTVLSWNDLYQ